MRTAIALFAALFSGPVAAFCGTYVGSPGVELTNQTSQVIISRQGTRTTLSLANDYVGEAKNFAMLIPVPEILGEDDITTVRPELFQRFDNYSAPRVVQYFCEDFDWQDGDMDADADSDADADADADDGSPGVVVEAEYKVGIYDVVILSAEESGALLTWLETNGYGVDASAQALLAEYIEGGAFFFAAKVNLDAAGEGGFLEPLQFGYESDVFSLPVRLGTLNSPGEQDVVMYILTDDTAGKVGIANYPQLEIEDECMADIWGAGGVDQYYGTAFENAFAAESGAGWIVEYGWATSWCDPCATQPPTNDELEEAGFDGDSWNTYFTRIRMRYTAEAATQDVTLYTSGLTDNEQIRYILYNEEMEDRFPVCGVGMVDNPGSCDEDDDQYGDDGGAGDGDDFVDDGDAEGGDSWAPYEIPEGATGTPRSERGCSSVTGTKGGLWMVLLTAAALIGRRRSAS